MHREFAPVAFIAAVSLALPFPWHWRARNVATLSIIAWLFVLNIIYGVDALIWGDNVNDIIPVWCDITTKLMIGANFALPSACLCIAIHLESVASVRQAQTSRSEKPRRQIFEALMCFGLPMVFMALHYIVQGHRYDIIEEYGCRPTVYMSAPAIVIIYAPPLLMSVLCLGFSTVALVHFMRRRITFARHLETSRNGFTTSRYFRLMLMSVVEMVWNIAATSFSLWFSMLVYRQWTNWADVHSDWNRADLYSTLFTPQNVLTSYYVLWWVVPSSTFLFVAFFSFGKEAIAEYKACITWFRRTILHQTVETTAFGPSFGSVPVARHLPSKLPSPPSLYNPSSEKKDFDSDHRSRASDSDSVLPPIPAYPGRAISSVDDLRLPTTLSMLPPISYQSPVGGLTPDDLPDLYIEPHQMV